MLTVWGSLSFRLFLIQLEENVKVDVVLWRKVAIFVIFVKKMQFFIIFVKKMYFLEARDVTFGHFCEKCLPCGENLRFCLTSYVKCKFLRETCVFG
jgi:hypothetical protein